MGISRVTLDSKGTERIFSAHGQGSDTTITLDLRKEVEGPRLGPRAMELVSMGLAACMGSTVMSILDKKRLSYEGVRIEVDADRAETGAMEFRSMAVRIFIDSEQVSAEEASKVVTLASKYCSAHHTLEHGVPITAAGLIGK